MNNSDGCEYCLTEYTREDWRDGVAHDIRIDGDELYYHDSRFGWESLKIKFCPMCGRPLTDVNEEEKM